MNQEKFDQHLIDYLYDELDEVTRAAMKRKIESDADCRGIEAGLRATIEVARLPVEEPGEELEERILAAASLAQQGEPWSRKVLRSLSWAGSHAMRPQIAMAAMLVLVLGSAMLLLRVRSGAVSVTPTKDDERTAAPATPADDAANPRSTNQALPPEQVAERQAPLPESSSAPRVTASGDPADGSTTDAPATDEELALADKQFETAMANYNAGRHQEAQREFAEVQKSKSPKAASAALYEARAVRAQSGCKAAIAYFNGVRARYASSSVAAAATWEQADCHRILGEAAQARQLWLALQDNIDYQAQAAKELESQGESAQSGGDGSSTRQRNSAPQPPQQVQSEDSETKK